MSLTDLRACLILGALLCALPAPAAPPAVPTAVAPTARTFVLQNVLAGEVLKTMHWDQAASLPPGVTQIVAPPATNSLLVVATPAGFTEVREVVKRLDVTQRQVRIQMALAKAAPADLKATGIPFDLIPWSVPLFPPGSDMGYATSGEVARFLQTLKKQGGVQQSLVITTTNNSEGAISMSGGSLADVESFRFAATPHVNSDGTVTLALRPQMTWRVAGKTNPDGTPATVTNVFQPQRTVRNGDTLVFTNVFAGAAGAGNGQLLLFVTPTILGDTGGAPSPPKE